MSRRTSGTNAGDKRRRLTDNVKAANENLFMNFFIHSISQEIAQAQPHLSSDEINDEAKRMFEGLDYNSKRKWKRRLKQQLESDENKVKPSELLTAKCVDHCEVQSTIEDIAAHVALVGEALTVVGEKCKENEYSAIVITGTRDYLMDSFLTTIGSLTALTTRMGLVRLPAKRYNVIPETSQLLAELEEDAEFNHNEESDQLKEMIIHQLNGYDMVKRRPISEIKSSWEIRKNIMDNINFVVPGF
ncbi:hypothetical protein SNEBB_000857 [Seison nebaliae]|nr:hypothetical protein SNEBB_000857 [Seison nebaliae]